MKIISLKMDINLPFRLNEIYNYRNLKTENNRNNLIRNKRSINKNLRKNYQNENMVYKTKNSPLNSSKNKNSFSVMNDYFSNPKIKSLSIDNSENNIHNYKRNDKKSLFEDEYFIEKLKKSQIQYSMNRNYYKKKSQSIQNFNFDNFLTKIKSLNNNNDKIEMEKSPMSIISSKSPLLNLPKVIIKNMPNVVEKNNFVNLNNCFEVFGHKINKEAVMEFLKKKERLFNTNLPNKNKNLKNHIKKETVEKNISYNDNNIRFLKKYIRIQPMAINVNGNLCEYNVSFEKDVKNSQNKLNDSKKDNKDNPNKQKNIILPNLKKQEQRQSHSREPNIIYRKTFTIISNDNKTINNTENIVKAIINNKNNENYIKYKINNNVSKLYTISSNKNITKSQSELSSPNNYNDKSLKNNILSEMNSKFKRVMYDIPPPNFYSKEFYYYNIYPNNCGWLIKKCFNHRIKWKECHSNNTNLYDFKWKDVGSTKDFINFSSEKKQMINHFEYHSCLSNKYNMFYNFAKYCEINGIDVFKYVPFTIGFDYLNFDELNTYQGNFKEIFNNINNYVFENDSINNQMYDRKKIPYKHLFPLSDSKMGNKFYCEIPKSHYMGKNLWIVKAPNLNRGRCIKIFDNYNEIIKFLNEMRRGNVNQYDNIKEKGCNEEKIKKINEIKIIKNEIEKENNDINKIEKKIVNEKEIKEKKNNSEDKKVKEEKDAKNANKKDNEKGKNKEKGDYQSDIIIIQKYIEKPFLYNGRKCDIRIWVLITHKMDVYIFKEGHLKASSVNYSVDNNNSFIHLTNYSLQKYNENFSKYEIGNEISFNIFQQYLDTLGEKSFNFRELIIPKFKEIIELTTKSSKNLINQKNKNYCFELFGYDFMMDEDKNVYLIEINTNPGLEISSEIIEILVPRMIDDTLRITVDELFETEYSKEWIGEDGNYKSNFHVEGYDDKENMWEFICNINDKGEEHKGYSCKKNCGKKKQKRNEKSKLNVI